MIKFNAKDNVFYLSNKYVSYVFKIASNGWLQKIYYGKPIKEEDLTNSLDLGWDWSKTYYSPLDDSEKIREDFLYNDESLFLLPTHGYGDVRPSLVVFTNKDGLNKVDFRYVSHRIYKGKPLLKEQPSFRFTDDIDSLEIILKDTLNEVEMVLTLSISDNYPVILRNQSIVNKGELICLNKAYSLMDDIGRNNFKIISFPGDWCLERQVQEEPLKYGNKVVSSDFLRSSHEENPFIFLADINADEDHGEVYGYSFLYSGSFKIETTVSKWDTVRVVGGINDNNFEYYLDNNQTFIFPESVMVYSDNGYNGVSHALHDIIREHLLPPYNKEVKESILLNSWEGCFMDFNTNKMIAFIDSASIIGAKMFVLDDGWFGKKPRDTDESSLGDWVVSEGKIDLGKVIDHCHNKGLKFGIWIEPEMVNIDSELYKIHPDWAIKVPNTEAVLSRHQFALDLTKEEVIDNVFGQIKKILDKYDIDYVKWDHNRNIFDVYSKELGKRQKEFHYRFTRGLYHLIEKFINAYPSILFEGCASGGARFDLGMLYYFPQIWCSDETDPVQRLFIQYGTSFMYPLESIGAHVSKNPITSYSTKANIAMFGTYGFEFDPRTLNAKEIEELKNTNKIFEKYHYNVIEKGDLYRLSSPYNTNYFCQMCVDKKQEMAIVLFVNLRKENRRYRFIKLKGLDDESYYYNNLDNSVHSGLYYKNIGLNITRWLDEFTSILVQLGKR